MPTIQKVIDEIADRKLNLPAFQRGYVWKRPAVLRFFESLYHGYPVGSLLVWDAGSNGSSAGSGTLLLDGQQRLTTLYGVIKGEPPPFFRDDAAVFTGLYFRVDEPAFSFPSERQIAQRPELLSVTEIMQGGVNRVVELARQVAVGLGDDSLITPCMIHLNQLLALLGRNMHVESVERVGGPALSLEDVVDIFNRVNSGGTKLGTGDLALAEISIDWPEAREEIRKQCRKWIESRREFSEDWLLMAMNVVMTGEDRFNSLADHSPQDLQEGFRHTVRLLDQVLTRVADRTGLDHTGVLIGHRAFYVMARYLQLRKTAPSLTEWDRLIHWYLQSAIWGRYIGASRANLAKDLTALHDARDSDMVGALMREFRSAYGSPRVQADHFDAKKNSRFYAILYALVRMAQARDWGSGTVLSKHQLGAGGQLDLHHVFPQARMKKLGLKADRINNLGNLSFLTATTNRQIGTRLPAAYLREYRGKDADALWSQCIPGDERLWDVDRYEDFLAARRKLLAKQVNQVLGELERGDLQRDEDQPTGETVVAFFEDAERRQLDELRMWMSDRRLPIGEILHEAAGAEGDVCTFDLAWPDGVQTELSQPVAVLLDEPAEVHEAANNAGFRFFTSIDEFKHYVETEILGEAADAA